MWLYMDSYSVPTSNHRDTIQQPTHGSTLAPTTQDTWFGLEECRSVQAHESVIGAERVDDIGAAEERGYRVKIPSSLPGLDVGSS
jgi:hypothetical protein